MTTLIPVPESRQKPSSSPYRTVDEACLARNGFLGLSDDHATVVRGL